MCNDSPQCSYWAEWYNEVAEGQNLCWNSTQILLDLVLIIASTSCQFWCLKYSHSIVSFCPRKWTCHFLCQVLRVFCPHLS
jgi:hypothetical protein